MSFEKIFHEENRQQTLLCFSYQRKIDKSQSVCMMTDEKTVYTVCASRTIVYHM